MATNVDVNPNKNESNSSVLRRFTRSFRETGIVRAVRGGRYFSRKKSPLTSKNSKLRRIDDSKKYTKLRRLGKIS